MLLGARQFFEKRGAPAWRNPYVTDGLLAMWDGEWNAGGGVHDPSATTWVDISGSGIDATVVDGVFTDSGFSVTRTTARGVTGATVDSYATSPWFTEDGPFTIEIGMDVSAITTATGWGNNFIYADPRVVVNRRHARSWDFSGKLYTGANEQPNVRIGSSINAYPTPLTLSLPFMASTSWDGRYDYRSHILFDATSASGYGNSSVTVVSDARICNFVSGSSFTVYVKRISIYRGIDDSRSAFNYAIDKARFNLP